MNRLNDALAWLGGAREDVLRDAPGERPRFVAMAGVLISTAALSGISAAFALAMALKVPVEVAVTGGLVWGAIILNLDRLLIVGMPKQTGVGRNVAAAIPRVVLALIIGAVISTPLTLQIFEPEISAELATMHREEKAAAEEALAADPRFIKIPALQDEKREAEATIAQGTNINLESDPNYVRAQDALRQAEADYEAAQLAWQQEFDGTGGSGIRGDGPITRSKQLARDVALAAWEQAKRNFASATDTARATLTAAAQKVVADAEANLATIDAQLSDLIDARAEEQAAIENSVDDSGGLLSRLEALFRLGEKDPLLNFAHLMLAALFVCVELLPVLFKLLGNLGKPTAYDDVVDVKDGLFVSAGRAWANKQLQAVEAEADVQVRVARHRADLQTKSGKRINQVVIDQQEKVVEHALGVWQKHASARAAQSIEEWEKELSNGQQGGQAAAAHVPTSRRRARRSTYLQGLGLPDPESP
jgi:hypothetical protein